MAHNEHGYKNPRARYGRTPWRLEFVLIGLDEQQQQEHYVKDQAVEHPVDWQPIPPVPLGVGSKQAKHHPKRGLNKYPERVHALPERRVRRPLDPIAYPHRFQHLLHVRMCYKLLLVVVHGCDQSRVRKPSKEAAPVPIP